jgi:hypothetical protein
VFATLRRVLLKIKTKGFEWTVRRIRRELYAPELPIVRSLNAKIFNTLNYLLRVKNYADNTTLNLIYDLRNAPATYNLGDVLFSAELYVLKNSYTGINVHFVLPERPDHPVLSVSWEKVNYRLRQLLIPLAQMHGCVKAVSVYSNSKELLRIVGRKNTYPTYYHPLMNIQLPSGPNPFEYNEFRGQIKGVSASSFGKMLVDAFRERESISKPIITLVIRSQKYDSPRNSNLKDWFLFANYLKFTGYFPVLIPDTESMQDISSYPTDLAVFIEAAVNVDARMALYEISYVVMGTSGGALTLASFNPNVPFISMNFFPVGSINNTMEHLSEFWGEKLEKLNQVWWAHESSLFSLRPDTYDNLIYEFNSFTERSN